ncbi:MAG: hypothetical protein ACLP0J_05340 [Solirubrobacteraceae bacterium]
MHGVDLDAREARGDDPLAGSPRSRSAGRTMVENVTHSLRRAVAHIVVICALLTLPVVTAGCGSAGHYVGNVVAHHIANHFAKAPATKRRVNLAFCAYSVYRAFHDITHHHLVFGALNAHQALRNCEAGFSKSKR